MPLNISGSIVNSAIVSTLNYKSIVTRGLVLHKDAGALDSYPTTGSTVFDLSTVSSSATLTNGPTYSSTVGSFVLDGTNDYIANDSNATVNGTISGTNSWTIDMWLYVIGDQAYMPYFNKGGYTEGLTIHGGRFEGGDGAGGHAMDVNIQGVSYNAWYLYTVTYDASTIRVYINAGNPYTYSWTYGFGTGSSYSVSWGTFWASSLHGNIASMKMYNRTLSTTEISQNYNAQKSRFGL